MKNDGGWWSQWGDGLAKDVVRWLFHKDGHFQDW